MSDNAKTFQSSAKELFKIQRDESILDQQSHYVEFYRGEGSMVGRVLGEDGSWSEEMS